MSKGGFNYSDGWGPRLRLRSPTSVLMTKNTTLLTCIENSYFGTNFHDFRVSKKEEVS
jgi:hypothetical protein